MNDLLNGFNTMLNMAALKQRRRALDLQEKSDQSQIDYRTMLMNQTQQQNDLRSGLNSYMSGPNEAGLTPAQMQIQYWSQAGYPEKGEEIVGQIMERGGEIAKVTGDPQQGVDFINKHLPNMKLEYKGEDDEGWILVKSPEHGILRWNPETEDVQHIPWPDAKAQKPEIIKYKKGDMEVAEIYRPDGKVEIVQSPLSASGEEKNRQVRFVLADRDTGEIIDERWINIYDKAAERSLVQAGYRSVTQEDLLLGDPLGGMVRKITREAMSPSGEVDKAERAVKEAEKRGGKKAAPPAYSEKSFLGVKPGKPQQAPGKAVRRGNMILKDGKEYPIKQDSGGEYVMIDGTKFYVTRKAQ